MSIFSKAHPPGSAIFIYLAAKSRSDAFELDWYIGQDHGEQAEDVHIFYSGQPSEIPFEKQCLQEFFLSSLDHLAKQNEVFSGNLIAEKESYLDWGKLLLGSYQKYFK
jgi:hypothetical protein